MNMKTSKFTITAIFCLIALISKSQNDSEVQGFISQIISRGDNHGKVIGLIPSTGQLVLAKSINYKQSAEGSSQVILSDARIIAKFNPPVQNRPEPGFNSYPGTLTNVSESGNTYILTCIPSSQICFSYFLPY